MKHTKCWCANVNNGLNHGSWAANCKRQTPTDLMIRFTFLSGLIGHCVEIRHVQFSSKSQSESYTHNHLILSQSVLLHAGSDVATGPAHELGPYGRRHVSFFLPCGGGGAPLF